MPPPSLSLSCIISDWSQLISWRHWQMNTQLGRWMSCSVTCVTTFWMKSQGKCWRLCVLWSKPTVTSRTGWNYPHVTPEDSQASFRSFLYRHFIATLVFVQEKYKHSELLMRSVSLALAKIVNLAGETWPKYSNFKSWNPFKMYSMHLIVTIILGCMTTQHPWGKIERIKSSNFPAMKMNRSFQQIKHIGFVALSGTRLARFHNK